MRGARNVTFKQASGHLHKALRAPMQHREGFSQRRSHRAGCVAGIHTPHLDESSLGVALASGPHRPCLHTQDISACL